MDTVRDAATVILVRDRVVRDAVRDRPDLEVFVVRRNQALAFAPGATVFPGGAVDPADGPVAAELGVAEEEVLEAMEVGGAYRSSSLDTRAGESAEPTSIERRLGAEDHGFDIAEHRVLLDAVLSDLTERERTIVELRFFHDKTQTEIAEEVGISQMHVSRLLARTLINLRERLETLDA